MTDHRPFRGWSDARVRNLPANIDDWPLARQNLFREERIRRGFCRSNPWNFKTRPAGREEDEKYIESSYYATRAITLALPRRNEIKREKPRKYPELATVNANFSPASVRREREAARLHEFYNKPPKDYADLTAEEKNKWWREGEKLKLEIAAQPPSAPVEPPPPLEIIRPEEFFGETIPPRQWIVPDWVPCGVVTGIYGDGGIGKSLLAQQLMTACAMGGEWCGNVAEPVASLGLFCEDDAKELLRRQERLNTHYGCGREDLARVRLVSRIGRDNLLMTFDRQGRGDTTPFQKQIVKNAREIGARLVVFDTAADGFAGNENDRGQVRQFISRALGSIAEAIDGAVVLCAHPSRSGLVSGEGDGGSTAWSNSLRSRLYLSYPPSEDGDPPKEDARVLRRRKANYAARRDEAKLVWRDGVFVADSPAANPYRRPVEDVFMHLLDAMNAEGRSVSHKRMAPNFAPRAFAARHDREGHREADFSRAMEALFADKKIVVETSGPPSKPKERVVRP